MPRPKPKKIRRRKKTNKTVHSAHFLTWIAAVLPYAASFLLTGILIGGSLAYALNSDLFVVRKVTISNFGPSTSADRFKFADIHVEQNILTTDLLAIEEKIRAKHPEYRDVRVDRILPDEISIRLRHRQPLAQVHWKQYHPLDGTGVLLRGESQVSDEDLPVIQGVPTPKGNIRQGARIHFEPLLEALRLLEGMSEARAVGMHRITRLDVSDSKNIILWLDDKIEIRMGYRNWPAKIRLFKDAIETIEIDPKKIRYMDFRFDDVVIGPR